MDSRPTLANENLINHVSNLTLFNPIHLKDHQYIIKIKLLTRYLAFPFLYSIFKSQPVFYIHSTSKCILTMFQVFMGTELERQL
jgi:hypothetical protein